MVDISEPFGQISNLIQNQFPDFYKEEGPNFIQFVKAYFEWLETTNNITYHTTKLLQYADIDKTPEDFIVHFKNTFLQNIQFNTETDKRLLIKNILDLYRSKGSEQSIKLFFQLIFGEDIDIYYPSIDIFKASDGKWIVPTYLEVSHSPNNLKFLGKEITGLTSGATAFVDRIVRRKIPSKYIDIFYITNVKGFFSTYEIVSFDGTNENNPSVIGSLSDTTIVSGGTNFEIGEVVGFTSNNGTYGQAIVSNTSSQTGLVDFQLVDGGFAYSNTANVIISSKVITISNVVVSNNELPPFNYSENFIEPLANIEFFGIIGGEFTNGSIVENYYANGDVAGSAVILTANQNPTLNSGSMIISTISGNVAYDSTFSLQGNSITASINTYSDQTAIGKIINIGSTITIGINVFANNFIVNERIVILDSSNDIVSDSTLLSYSSSPTINNLKLSVTKGNFYSNSTILGLESGSTAKIQNLTLQLGLISISEAYSNLSGNYAYGNTLGTNTTITFVSTGAGASFGIDSIENTETVVLNTDVLSGNNSVGTPYFDILLDGSNSGVAANGYGFPLDPSAGPNDILSDYLTLEEISIGTISKIGSKNPGSDYNISPIVFVIDPKTDIYNRKDFQLNISNLSKGFTVGEIVTQNIVISNTATLNLNSSANVFYSLEEIYQNNGTSNIATGTIQGITADNLTITNVVGTFSNAYQISGVSSGSNAYVLIANNGSINDVVTGQLVDGNNSVIFVRRLNLFKDFQANNILTGQSSGFNANVTYVDIDYSSRYDGENAIVSSNVVVANGTVTALEIYDSGLGYLDGELVTFGNANNDTIGSVILHTTTQGKSKGFFSTSDSFLSSNKYLEDNYYYQTYSYQINSSLNFDEYAEMIKKVLHVAGTKMFGSVIKTEELDLDVEVAEFSIQKVS